jgi:hypothetical protein
MNIILSRKGFDSSLGGVPSPLFPSGEMYSLPIPERYRARLANPLRYQDIHSDVAGVTSVGDLVKDLTNGQSGPQTPVHLDPDLNSVSLPREEQWRPVFGQGGKAESHLQNQQVGVGDLFIYFGWFKQVERMGAVYRYVRGAPNLHVIFGWLQVERRIALHAPAQLQTQVPAWAHYHPHCRARVYEQPDSLYVATSHLSLPGIHLDQPGGGVFRRYSPALRLTAEGRTRSYWRLPRWFHPVPGRRGFSHHEDLSHWEAEGDTVVLNSGGRGQEFVLDCQVYPEALSWVAQLFEQPDA